MEVEQEFKLIDQFMVRTRHLLSFLVSVRAGFVPVRLHGLLVESWPRIPAAMEGMRAQIRDASASERERIGFTGQHLLLKMNSFHFAADRLESAIGSTPLAQVYQASRLDPVPTDLAPPKLNLFMQKLVKLLLAVLRFVNSTLESLKQLTGFAEIVKEFKEVLENLLHTKEAVES